MPEPKAAARKIGLTDRSLLALRPAADGHRQTIWDSLMPGMAVRVSGKGKRSFYAVRRRAGQANPSWILLGAYPVMTLAEARARAREALGALIAGDDPAALAEARRREREEAERRSKAGTFAPVAERFIAGHLPRLRTRRVYEALIRRELIPALGDRPIGEIRPRDIVAMLEAIVARGVPQAGRVRLASGGEHAARHALAALRKIFAWALSRDVEGLEANPCARVKADDLFGGAVRARDRVLNPAELRAVWRAAEAEGYPFGDLVRALLLTGQRLREIGNARWSEVGEAALAIPAARMKNKEAHSLPLTDRMRALLDGLPRFGDGDFLFTTTTGRLPIGGFSRAKRRLDVKIAEGGDTIAHWRLHDLRRSARTGMAKAGILPFIAELVIGHRQSGVHAVYDLHTYDAEKRAALEKWEARLMEIVAPEPEPGPAVVVPLRRVRG
jgi:integrase